MPWVVKPSRQREPAWWGAFCVVFHRPVSSGRIPFDTMIHMSDSPPVTVLDAPGIETLAAELGKAAGADPTRRVVAGIAGIAGSGKSTLAERLVAQLNAASPGSAVWIPMDGFHRPNDELDARGWRTRKGAPWTYDAAAYQACLERFGDAANVGTFPVYCRVAHNPVPGDVPVTPGTRVIVTEGQYLLYDHPDWHGVADQLTHRWFLDVDPTQTRAWLMKRDTSVGRTVAEAEAKYAANDALNTELVLGARLACDRVLQWSA